MIDYTASAVEARGAAADDILIAAGLARRPARPPDFAAESEALHTLARLLIDCPEALPGRLAAIALDLCHAGSAGVSLLEETPQGAVFRWTALAGQLAPYQGGSTPRDFSPCGLCLDRGEAILVADPARRFDYFNAVGIPIVEGLVLPLFGAGKRPLGTLWIVAHHRERQFDGEDLQVMTRLADFTALAIECGAAQAQAKDSEQRSRELLDALPAAIYTTDAAGRITYCNEAAVDLAGRRPEFGRDEWCITGRLYRPDGTPLPRQECPMAMALKENRPVRGEEAVAERPDGTRVPFIPHPTPLRDLSGRLVGGVNMLVDITERKRSEALTECQKHALQMLAQGAPLDDVLGYLIRTIEGHCANGMLGSILLLNGAGTHFERGIGPNLPEEFNRAVEGIAVSSAIGVCCRAVSRRAPVAVQDFSADPQWARFVEFVAPYDLRAGWSAPIFGSDGRVLGTFANYYRCPCDPTPSDLEWVEIVKRTAAIAIERAQAVAALRHNEERLAQELAAAQRLQETSTRLIQEGDAGALYDQILDAAVAIMHSDMASMQMLDPERDSLRLLAWKGFDPQSAAAWRWVSLDFEQQLRCGPADRPESRRAGHPDMRFHSRYTGVRHLPQRGHPGDAVDASDLAYRPFAGHDLNPLVEAASAIRARYTAV